MKRLLFALLLLAAPAAAQNAPNGIWPSLAEVTTVRDRQGCYSWRNCAINTSRGVARGLNYMIAAAYSPSKYEPPGGGTIVWSWVQGGSTLNSFSPGIGLDGPGIKGATSYLTKFSGSWNVPATGSVVVLTRVFWAHNDGAAHQLFKFGNSAFPAGPAIEFNKFSDNQIYFGWVNGGSGTRAVTAGGYSWAAGDLLSLGGTWSSSGTKLYVNGLNAASNGSAAPSTSVSSQPYFVGSNNPASNYWNTDSRDVIYYIAWWDRVLSDAEFQYLYQNPFALYVSQDIPVPGPSVISVLSRSRGIIIQ